MKKAFQKANITILILIFLPTFFIAAQSEYAILTDDVLHTIDHKVYGHFLEHIYNSVNNGLWGDLIWNRSLERFAGSSGSWHIEGDEVVQTALSENVRLMFGDTSWDNYEFTLQARKDEGAEGFLILFRANGENFYWCNIGGWSNSQHAIEKGVTGTRWGVFGNPVSGSINTGQWYDIKVRCEENHFQVWLNTSKIFDFTDNSAHKTGQVGIGTWATKSRYRNLKVTVIPSGELLFEGLPKIQDEEATLFNWTTVGTGTMYRSDDALNSNSSVKIVNTASSETGLEQRSIYLKPQSYHGSFWAKGSTPSELKIQLRSGATVLSEQSFDPPTGVWQEFEFNLSSAVETTNGTLRISFNDTGTVYLDQISMMGQDAINNDGFRPDLFNAIKDLRPPVIRWPGGYFAEYYRWKDGIGPQHQRGIYPLEAWNDQDVNSFGTDEFMTLCRRLNAEPIVVINIGHRLSPVPQAEYIEEAQHWVEYCNGPATSEWGAVRAANGLAEPYNVKYWEISNEIWLTRDANTYVQFLKAFIPALKQVDPSIKIIACGSGSFDQAWNRVILQNCADLIDYISTHHYEDIANYKTGVRNYDNFLKTLTNEIQSSSNPNIKIYMSEWNVWDGLDWRTGLYAGGMLNIFEKNGETFQIGGPALFLRHSSATGWNNAFINFNNSSWFPATNYVVMKFWFDHFAPQYVRNLGQNADLNVVSTMSEDSQTLYIKVINTAVSAIPIRFEVRGEFQPKSVRVDQIAPPSLSAQNSMANPNAIKIERGDAQIDGQFVTMTIPALGAVIVTVSQDPNSKVGLNETDAIHDYRLYTNYPNPFNPNTMLRYDVPRPGRVTLRIVDVLGRQVKVLVDDAKTCGSYVAEWDGTNENGERVSSGVYVCELNTASESFSQKMSLVR